MKLTMPSNQNAETLLALIQWKSLSSVQLRRLTTSSYPPARINDLKRRGVRIRNTYTQYKKARGRVVLIARYILTMPKIKAAAIYKKINAA